MGRYQVATPLDAGQYVQQIASLLSEGLILADINQTIRWANPAALAMHGVSDVAELGATVHDYHANFQVRFRNAQASPTPPLAAGTAQASYGRGVVIEVTPTAGNGPAWTRRTHTLVLTDSAGQPAQLLMIFSLLDEPAAPGARYASAIDWHPHAAVILRHADQRLVAGNALFRRMTGCDSATTLPQNIHDTGLRDSLDESGAMRRSLAAGGPIEPCGARLVRPDGSTKNITWAGQPVTFEGESCMLLTFTEGEQHGGTADVAARAAPQDPWAAYTAVPVPLQTLDADMRIHAISEAWLKWLGYEHAAVTGRRITDFMTPSSASHFQTHTWLALRDSGGSHQVQCQFLRQDGDCVDVLISLGAVRDSTGAFLHAVVVATDITNHKRSEESFARTFGMAPVPMLIGKLSDGRILDANEAFEAVTGHAAQMVIGHSLNEFGLFETAALRQKFEGELRAAGRIRNMDLPIRTVSGEILRCAVSAERLHVFGQDCAVLALQEVTERRRNEAQLCQAIEEVMRDSAWFGRSVVEKLAALRAPPANNVHAAQFNDLTRREREVLVLLSHGLPDAAIAGKLGLTRCTVRNHVAALYGKLDVHSRSEAIVWARERGINNNWAELGPAAAPRRREEPQNDAHMGKRMRPAVPLRAISAATGNRKAR